MRRSRSRRFESVGDGFFVEIEPLATGGSRYERRRADGSGPVRNSARVGEQTGQT